MTQNPETSFAIKSTSICTDNSNYNDPSKKWTTLGDAPNNKDIIGSTYTLQYTGSLLVVTNNKAEHFEVVFPVDSNSEYLPFIEKAKGGKFGIEVSPFQKTDSVAPK